jgi:hypothetical protein
MSLSFTFESIVEYVGPQSVEDRFLISVGCQLIIRRIEAAVEGESTPLPKLFGFIHMCGVVYE